MMILSWINYSVCRYVRRFHVQGFVEEQNIDDYFCTIDDEMESSSKIFPIRRLYHD